MAVAGVANSNITGNTIREGLIDPGSVRCNFAGIYTNIILSVSGAAGSADFFNGIRVNVDRGLAIAYKVIVGNPTCRTAIAGNSVIAVIGYAIAAYRGRRGVEVKPVETAESNHAIFYGR